MTRTATLDASASLMTDIHAHLRACEASVNRRTAEFHLHSANALIDGPEFLALPETVQEEIFERYAAQAWRINPVGV
jgi:hypothetical protein